VIAITSCTKHACVSSGGHVGSLVRMGVSSRRPADFEPASLHGLIQGGPFRSSDLEPYWPGGRRGFLQVDCACTRSGDDAKTLTTSSNRFSPADTIRDGPTVKAIEQSKAIGLLLNTPVLELGAGRTTGSIRSRSLRARRRSISAVESRVRLPPGYRRTAVCCCFGRNASAQWPSPVPNPATPRPLLDGAPGALCWRDVVTSNGYELQFEDSDTVPSGIFASFGIMQSPNYSIGGCAHLDAGRINRNQATQKELWQPGHVRGPPEWSNKVAQAASAKGNTRAVHISRAEFEQFPRNREPDRDSISAPTP